MTAAVKVGEFEFDPATGTLTGPAAFMRSDDYAEWLARFNAGDDVVFRTGAAGASPSPEVAMLVSVQTCYAGWHGREVFNRMRGAK
jgi:hypothetical protein